MEASVSPAFGISMPIDWNLQLVYMGLFESGAHQDLMINHPFPQKTIISFLGC